MFKRLSILLAFFAFSVSSQAVTIDFTNQAWKDAIGMGNTEAIVDGIKLSSTGGNLTLLGSGTDFEITGCNNAGAGLACTGDGIGISNDEISEGGVQQLTLSFLNGPVNVENIFLLDLFGLEGTGETAIINGGIFHNTSDNQALGGYYETGFSDNLVSTITFLSPDDGFSDYALAKIEISPVPIPGAAILFGSALLGFFGFKRRRAV